MEMESKSGKEDDIYRQNHFQVHRERRRNLVLILLSSAYLGAYVGMESSAFQFLPTFARFTPLHLSQPEGALLLSAFTGAFTVGRVGGILIVRKVVPEFLLGFNFLLILGGNSLLFFGNASWLSLVVGVLLLGLGFSTVYAVFLGYIQRYLRVGNLVGAVLVGMQSLISGVYPLLVGRFTVETPFVHLWANFFSLSLASVSFLIIWKMVHSRRLSNRDDSDGESEGGGRVLTNIRLFFSISMFY